MSLLGNVFLALATILSFIMISSTYGSKPPTSGDAAMGYPLGVILFNLAFLACMSIAAVAIAGKGGFDWMSDNKSARNGLVVLGLLVIVFTAATSALFKFEANPPYSVRYLSAFAPALFPIILIVCSVLMLNEGLRAAVPLAVYKIPLVIVFWISVLCCIGCVVEAIGGAQKNAANQIASMQDDEARYHQERLAEVDSCDVMTNMTHILVFTDRNHHPELRARAVAKVKSHPDWQQALVNLLEGDGAIEAFYFLGSNEVDDKTLFPQALDKGTRRVALWIRSSIQEYSHSSHFYAGQFSYEVDRILWTLDQFQGLSVDFLPAVRELRAALDEPNQNNPKGFDCQSTLDRWIKKHQ